MTFDFSQITEVPLIRFGSNSAEHGLCAMQMVAFFQGEKHTDSPECTCPVLAAFVRRINDRIKRRLDRNRLLMPMLPKLVGTVSPEHEEARALILVDAAPSNLGFEIEAARAIERKSWAAVGDMAASCFGESDTFPRAVEALEEAIKAGPQGDFAHDPAERYEALKRLVSA